MNALQQTTGALFGALMAALATGFGLAASADQVTVDCRLHIAQESGHNIVVWQSPQDTGTNLCLESASSPVGPWTTVTGAASPFTVAKDQTTNQFFRTVWIPPTDCPSALQIAQSVRSFVASAHPQWNPTAEITMRLVPVQGLWEAMQVQLISVRDLGWGQDWERFACVLYQDQVNALGLSFGGYGLMSGVVRGDSLYFTYSWGSGMHRSHLGKLQIVNGKLHFWDSGGLFNWSNPFVDLFVSATAGGGLTVLEGTFEGFNQWRAAVEYGHIDESKPSSPKLIGTDGRVLATLEPTEYSY